MDNSISVEGLVLPNKALSNFELMDAVKEFKIPNFRGVFMQNDLPPKALKRECGILNLDGVSFSQLGVMLDIFLEPSFLFKGYVYFSNTG